MHTDKTADSYIERRREARLAKLRNHRVEIKFAGHPIYQFKVTDVSANGAGLLINTDSRFLSKIEVGQTIAVNFISPQGEEPAGLYNAEIRHITEMENGPYKGLKRAGILILERLVESDDWR
jgi:hypothetical protein